MTRTEPAARGMPGFAWRIWPWMSWLLPVGFCAQGIANSGGVMSFLLLFGAVIIVPIAGILGTVPRWILRERGFAAAPASLVGLLLLHWWSWIAFSLTVRDFDFHGDPVSFLRTVWGVPISDEPTRLIHDAAAVVGVASWGAVLVLALIVKPDGARRRGWIALSWSTAALAPVIIVAAISAGVQATSEERDSAGEDRAVVNARSVDGQRELLFKRYELQQAALAAVRAVIVPGVWAASETEISDEDCGEVAQECYRIVIGFIFTPEAPIDVDEVAETIASAGWSVEPVPDSEDGAVIRATDAEGRALTFADDSNGSYLLELRSAWWWVSYEAHRDFGIGAYRGLEPHDDTLFAPDEWPELTLP